MLISNQQRKGSKYDSKADSFFFFSITYSALLFQREISKAAIKFSVIEEKSLKISQGISTLCDTA